jgi:esterase/lipase
MKEEIKSEGKFNYIEKGEGTPIIILHGLMGGLSNFDGVAQFFPENGYKVVIPELPLYSMPLLKTSVSNFAKYIKEFIDFKNYSEVILLGKPEESTVQPGKCTECGFVNKDSSKFCEECGTKI